MARTWSPTAAVLDIPLKDGAGCDHHLTKRADPHDLVALLHRHAARLMKARPAEPAKATWLKVKK